MTKPSLSLWTTLPSSSSFSSSSSSSLLEGQDGSHHSVDICIFFCLVFAHHYYLQDSTYTAKQLHVNGYKLKFMHVPFKDHYHHMKLIIALLLTVAFAAMPNTIMVQLEDGIQPQWWGEQHHLGRYLGAHPTLGHLGYHRFEKPQSVPSGDFKISHLLRDTHVKWAAPMIARQRFNRTLLYMEREPLYNQQWHLHGSVTQAWEDENVRGRGVVVAIVDDGLQHSHPDLQTNYVATLSYDYNHLDNDPEPHSPYNAHGTSAAGVCCAARNGVCGVGVAPEASLVGLQLIAGWVSDYDESVALTHEGIDIYSCSWGPADDATRLEAPGRVLRDAFRSYTEEGIGRGGKGSIYVWAGGNGRQHADNCNYDGYASSRFTIAVGASTFDQRQAWYSEPCAALHVVAPSSGTYGKGITTTDLTGQGWGYNRHGDCTNDFGGTSSAAPFVTGVVALMLEAQPRLTWRDVQHILARTAEPLETWDTDWTARDDGFSHSHAYGFGRVHAKRAVTMAKLWINNPKRVCGAAVRQSRITGRFNPATLHFEFAQNAHMNFIEHVEVRVQELIVYSRGVMTLTLHQSDNGITSRLMERHTSDTTRGIHDWTFTSVRHWGTTFADNVWSLSSNMTPFPRATSITLTIFGC